MLQFFSPHSYNLSQHVRKNLSTFIEKTFACGPYAFGSLARLTFFSLSAKTCDERELYSSLSPVEPVFVLLDLPSIV